MPLELQRLQESGPDGLELEVPTPDGPLPLAVIPFGRGGRREGFLVVESRRSFSELDWISLRHAVTACSLIAARLRAVREREWQLRRDIFWKLIEDCSGDVGLAAERARQLGIPAGVPVAVLVVRFVPAVSGHSFKNIDTDRIRGDEDVAVVVDDLEMVCFLVVGQRAGDGPGLAAHLKQKARRVGDRLSAAVPLVSITSPTRRGGRTCAGWSWDGLPRRAGTKTRSCCVPCAPTWPAVAMPPRPPGGCSSTATPSTIGCAGCVPCWVVTSMTLTSVSFWNWSCAAVN